MEIGNKVYIVNVYNEEGDYKSNFKTKKKAQLLNMPGVITAVLDYEDIRYSFGNIIHAGTIGFNCFLTEIEAINRINGLNEYFKNNGVLIED